MIHKLKFPTLNIFLDFYDLFLLKIEAKRLKVHIRGGGGEVACYRVPLQMYICNEFNRDLTAVVLNFVIHVEELHIRYENGDIASKLIFHLLFLKVSILVAVLTISQPTEKVCRFTKSSFLMTD